MLVFDTNILIYALDARAEMHQSCVNRLEQARRDVVPSYLTWSICYEFLRAATHPRVLARPRRLEEAWEFLESLLDSPGISVLRPTERHTASLAQTIREAPDLRGNRAHDMHIAALMREHGLSRICTIDAGFRRFSFLSVTAP